MHQVQVSDRAGGWRQRLSARSGRLGAAAAGAAVALGTVAAAGAAPAFAHRGASMAARGHHGMASKRHRGMAQPPLKVTVFSPGAGDHSGAGGFGFVVDLSIDATKARDNYLLSAAAGYQPFFNDPSAPTFHPGPDPGAPGLVVLLSTTPSRPGTPFQGPRTNLAGLFQINGVARVMGGLAETWNTWQVGKPLFGTGPTRLAVYVVKGTAPAVVPTTGLKRISNVVTVPFDING
ncbi:MAG TPA: hypothetical protein VKV27_12845 [Solirubrobacteraceae bacterium]|nr:hypothetical protein [Solirubrobacteraceae bacterium]